MTLATRVRGFWTANASIHEGRLAGLTNTLETNATGNIHTNPADCTASGSCSVSPTQAAIHENENPSSTVSANASTASGSDVVTRKPTT